MAAWHTSQAPKSLTNFNATLLPLSIAKIPPSFSLIKPTLITTLLSIPVLEVDPVLLVFLLKPLFGLLNPLRSSGQEAKNWDNDFADEEDEECFSTGVLLLHSVMYLELLRHI